MKKDQFDELFDTTFEETIKNHEFVPDSEASWQKVEYQLNRRLKSQNRFKALPFVAASFVLGAVLFGTPVVTSAFTPFYHTIKSIQQGMVSFIFGSDEGHSTKPKTLPPPDQPQSSSQSGQDVKNGDTSQKDFGSWEEASKFVSFQPPKIKFVPDGFKLSKVLNFFPHGRGNATTAILLYSGPENMNFTITLRQIEKGEKLASGYQEDSGTFQNIKINNNDAYLFLAKDGTTSVEYMVGGMYISVIGNVNKEQTIQIASNIN